MTFSDAKVAEFVNANFVSAWHNRAPGFKNDDPKAEEAIFEHSTEAYTTKNICTFFMTPDGTVFHYFAGYLSPDLFLKHAALAAEIRKAAFDESMRLKEGGLAAARERQAAALAALQEDRRVDGQTLEYRGHVHTHGAKCGHPLREYHQYAKALHQVWIDAKELPALETIRYSYLYGNDFTEESTGATPIRGRNAIPVG